EFRGSKGSRGDVRRAFRSDADQHRLASEFIRPELLCLLQNGGGGNDPVLGEGTEVEPHAAIPPHRNRPVANAHTGSGQGNGFRAERVTSDLSSKAGPWLSTGQHD